MNNTSLILASSSPTRSGLLRSALIPFKAVSASVDEQEIKIENIKKGIKPFDIAYFLAKAKAEKISEDYPDHFVLGCDQVLDFEGHLLSKAGSVPEAEKQLLMLRSQTHHLHNALIIMHNHKILWHFQNTVSLTMRNFTDEFLYWYLDQIPEEQLKKVGVYALESLGSQLFEEISGDYFSILGLPLLPLLSFLRQQKILRQ